MSPSRLGRFGKGYMRFFRGSKTVRTDIEGEHMTKRNSSTIAAACLVAVLALCTGFFALKPLPGVVDADTDWREIGPEIEHPFGEKSVKGAPFSAQVFMESTQTLANGVHVSNK